MEGEGKRSGAGPASLGHTGPGARSPGGQLEALLVVLVWGFGAEGGARSLRIHLALGAGGPGPGLGEALPLQKERH